MKGRTLLIPTAGILNSSPKCPVCFMRIDLVAAVLSLAKVRRVASVMFGYVCTKIAGSRSMGTPDTTLLCTWVAGSTNSIVILESNIVLMASTSSVVLGNIRPSPLLIGILGSQVSEGGLIGRPLQFHTFYNPVRKHNMRFISPVLDGVHVYICCFSWKTCETDCLKMLNRVSPQVLRSLHSFSK